MQLDLWECELCLADNAPLRLNRARGLTVVCTSGRVWLTVEGEAGDIFLFAGQSHRLIGNGLALLEAVGSGCVKLQPAPTPLQRLGILLARHFPRSTGPAGPCQKPA